MDQISRTPIVIKIGGSTLGSNDTSIRDAAALAAAGEQVVIVHGGGKMITDWLAKMGVATRFVRGLRVTDAASIDVVVGVLAGVVNTRIVAGIAAENGRAIGLTGADGGLLRVVPDDPELGFVGRVAEVDPAIIRLVLANGVIPVIAPIGLGHGDHALYNVNADTAAGEIAAALGARLVFLTDVAGVSANGELLRSLSASDVERLIADGTIGGGMIPKVEACLAAGEAIICDGRDAGALPRALRLEIGTLVSHETVRP